MVKDGTLEKFRFGNNSTFNNNKSETVTLLLTAFWPKSEVLEVYTIGLKQLRLWELELASRQQSLYTLYEQVAIAQRYSNWARVWVLLFISRSVPWGGHEYAVRRPRKYNRSCTDVRSWVPKIVTRLVRQMQFLVHIIRSKATWNMGKMNGRK